MANGVPLQHELTQKGAMNSISVMLGGLHYSCIVGELSIILGCMVGESTQAYSMVITMKSCSTSVVKKHGHGV